jgi:hypothetical protein
MKVKEMLWNSYHAPLRGVPFGLNEWTKSACPGDPLCTGFSASCSKKNDPHKGIRSLDFLSYL